MGQYGDPRRELASRESAESMSGNERCLNDGGGNACAADVDLDGGPRRGEHTGEVARPDGHAERRAHGATAYLAHQRVIGIDAIGRARYGALVEAEPDQAPERTGGALGEQGLAADERRFLEVDDPVERRIERRGCRVELMAVERHGHLEAERVPRGEPGR